MEVVSKRSALLSNYEVLKLLKELESEHLAQAKTALRVKKEEEEARLSGNNGISTTSGYVEEVCENLRTVEFEAIQYLTAEYQPVHSHSEDSIAKLVKGLEPYDLTKAEKLQIVNLVPTEPVELYVIVEELEDRLADKMDEVLDVVRSSIVPVDATVPNGQSAQQTAYVIPSEKHEYTEEMFDDWEEPPIDEFDDMGDGAGVEGDLEMDDDD